MNTSQSVEEDISLVPETGIQFLDFELSLEGQKAPMTMFLRTGGDPTHGEDDIVCLDEDEQGVIGYWDSENTRHTVKQESFTVSFRDIVRMFSDEWVPLPFFRTRKGADPHNGPINWVRGRISPVTHGQSDGGFEKSFKLTLAVDTNLMPRIDAGDYLAPSEDDVKNGDEFGFIADQRFILDFLDMEWVDEWMYELYRDHLFKAPRGITPKEDDVFEAMCDGYDTSRYHTAAYIALLDVLRLRLENVSLKLVSRNSPAFDVDLVLDLGNSRVCGLILESNPDQDNAELNKAEVLKIRNLSNPEMESTGEPFDSRVEFNLAYFGKRHLSKKSGRMDAFEWHSMVRVGDEATKLAGQIDAQTSYSGMSSPKRYLWDLEEREQEWVFNNTYVDKRQTDQENRIGKRGEHRDPAKNKLFSMNVTSGGEPVDGSDPAAVFAAYAHYCRSSLMTFAVSEIIVQALCMINSWEYRKHKGNVVKPRRLNTIIMTIPSAMVLQERDILSRRAQAAIDLIWICQGWSEQETPKPRLEVKWDESSATQLVYLYSEVAESFSGDARGFFKLTKRPFLNDPRPEQLRLASIDIGGGTTDLVINDYTVLGSGVSGVIEPRPIFREGFSIAGDDVLKAIIEEHVLNVIKHAMVEAGVDASVTDGLMMTLFGADSSGKGAEDQKLRQLFINNIARPIALRILTHYEQYAPPDKVSVEPVTFLEVFPGDADPTSTEMSDVNARQFVDELVWKNGGANFVLRELSFPVNVRHVEETIDQVMSSVMNAICAIIEAHAVDILLLSGRPSRFPYVGTKIERSHALPASRIVSLSQYSVGSWYPFRDTRSRITDPKTTAAMGAAILAISKTSGSKKFAFRSESLGYSSTMRYIGHIVEGRVRDEGLFYRDVDLENEDYQFMGEGGEFSSAMHIGFRQMPVDWWPATKIYEIDFAKGSVEKLAKWTPLKVTLKRENQKSGATDETFSIDEIISTNPEAPTFGPKNLTFRMKTLREDDGYWLDTGVIYNR